MSDYQESLIALEIQDYYYDYVNAAGSEPANLSMARNASREIFRERVRNGEIEFSDEDLDDMHDSKFDDIDKRAAKSADRLIVQLFEWGMESLLGSDDPVLRTPVKLGDGRRKALWAVTLEDLHDMYELRDENRRRVNESADKWEQTVSTATPVMNRYGTIGSAANAGVFDRRRDIAS